MLIFYAGKYVNAVTAEDLVQDVFLKVWQKRTFLFLKEGIKTYLYRSVQHACLDYLKHQEVKGDYINAVTTKLKIEEIYYNDDPQSLFAEDERLELIYKEIDKLPDKCREIFTMSYLEERNIIRKTKCFDFWERNVLFPKTKRSFFRTPTLPFSA